MFASLKNIPTQAIRWIGVEGIKDPANFLMVTAVTGWALSCLAQVSAISLNKKIPDKEKKFQIPQEIADGATNCLLFLFFTQNFKQIGKWAVTNGFNPIIHSAQKANIAGKSKEVLKDLIKNASPVVQNGIVDNSNGAVNLFAIIGSIIASNIATPYARNYLASYWQKKRLCQQDPNMEVCNMSPKSNDIPFKNVGPRASSMNDYIASTRKFTGSLRI